MEVVIDRDEIKKIAADKGDKAAIEAYLEKIGYRPCALYEMDKSKKPSFICEKIGGIYRADVPTLMRCFEFIDAKNRKGVISGSIDWAWGKTEEEATKTLLLYLLYPKLSYESKTTRLNKGDRVLNACIFMTSADNVHDKPVNIVFKGEEPKPQHRQSLAKTQKKIKKTGNEPKNG